MTVSQPEHSIAHPITEFYNVFAMQVFIQSSYVGYLIFYWNRVNLPRQLNLSIKDTVGKRVTNKELPRWNHWHALIVCQRGLNTVHQSMQCFNVSAMQVFSFHNKEFGPTEWWLFFYYSVNLIIVVGIQQKLATSFLSLQEKNGLPTDPPNGSMIPTGYSGKKCDQQSTTPLKCSDCVSAGTQYCTSNNGVFQCVCKTGELISDIVRLNWWNDLA